MTAATGRWLRISRVASVAYTLCFVAGSFTSVRRGYGARPLGIRTGLSPRAEVIAGGGAALAAPWPLIALLWHGQARAGKRGQTGRRATARVAVLGGLFLAGAAAEPISHDLIARRLRMDEAVVAILNVVLPMAIMSTAAASLVEQDGL